MGRTIRSLRMKLSPRGGSEADDAADLALAGRGDRDPGDRGLAAREDEGFYEPPLPQPVHVLLEAPAFEAETRLREDAAKVFKAHRVLRPLEELQDLQGRVLERHRGAHGAADHTHCGTVFSGV